jgi:hypothetical protein
MVLMPPGSAKSTYGSAYNVIAADSSNHGPGSIVSGHGIYDEPHIGSVIYPGSFVLDPHDGSDPSTWQLGTDGQAAQTLLNEQIAEDMTECGAVVWPWSETDSYRPYSEKAIFKAAAQRFMALERGMLPGATAANMPLIWWNAIPYGNTDGVQMHREVVAELASDPMQGVVIGNPMTADSSDRAGDKAHRSTADNRRFAQLAAPIVARALLVNGRGDAVTAIPNGIPVAGGPRITHAYRQNSSTILLTIAHDAGTDLVVPPLAETGQGFVVMDGGSVSSPGTLRQATACVRIDATHLRLTLASPLNNQSASCLLFYPYGSFSPAGAASYTADMGTGGAVYDNVASVSKPLGWDIAADLGISWQLNFPLAATSAPIVLSDSPC